MLNLVYNITGISMFIWYLGLRWTFCASEHWVYNPINLATALVSIAFIIPTLFKIQYSFKKVFYYVFIFLSFRNFYYSIEDFIDFLHYPSRTQFFYIVIDLIMLLYVVIWGIYYRKNKLVNTEKV